MVLNGSLWKGVFLIGSGTAIAQLIGIISTPLITRLYDPSDFGLLGLFSSILTTLLAISSLRYEFAIPIPKNSSKAANLLVLCSIILIGTIGVTFIILLLFGEIILSMLGEMGLMPYLWLVSLGLLGGGIYEALNYWAIRQQDYRRITKTRISQSLGGAISKILFGVLCLGPLGLILGYIISNVVGIYTYVKAIVKNDLDTFSSVSLAEIRSVSKEYRSFPLYSAPASLLYAVSLQIPILMLSFIYGLDVVGWYTLAYQMVAIPVGLIAGSMAQAFYGEAAKNAREKPGELRRLYMDTTKNLALIGIPLVSIVALIAPYIFPIVFGEAWENAGLFCLPLALVAISQFIVTPTSKLAVYGFNRLELYFNCIRIILILGGFYLASMLALGPLLTLTIYGIIMSILYYALYLLNLYAINKVTSRG